MYIDKFVFLNTVPLNFIFLESDFGHREGTFKPSGHKRRFVVDKG